jgi:molybdate/tungstate transport system permease protein
MTANEQISGGMIKRGPFFALAASCAVVVMAFILLPLLQMMTSPKAAMLVQTVSDREVLRSIRLSLITSGAAALIALMLGTPLAYLLARCNFRGKRLAESVIDLPIVIPHPVVGIAILSVAGRNHWFGQILAQLGIRIMGSVTGIITVLTFVGLPFFVSAAKAGFESVPPRLENVSRSLGASLGGTFFRVTLPLARRSLLIGFIMCAARAISEFGAVVIVAYHPMIAPVMIYERFEAFGLKYSQPVAFWLVSICLLLFLLLRLLTLRKDSKR